MFCLHNSKFVINYAADCGGASRAKAEENLRLHKDYYRVGTTTMTDLLLAEEQYQQACDRYTDAFAVFQTKQLESRQATGQ